MNVSVRPAAAQSASPIARIEVYSSLAEAEPHWRALEAADVLSTPYQRFDVMSSWLRHIGTAEGVEPFIVIAFASGGAPLFLLPLGRRQRNGVRFAEFLGGKHMNFNLAIWRRDIAAALSRDMLETALAPLAATIDALLLGSQPLIWEGVRNPLSLLDHVPSASMGHSGALLPDFDALLRSRTNSETRKKMRKKERNLAALGAVRFAKAQSPDEARRVLHTFFQQKRARMRTLGQPDVFGDANVQRFLADVMVEPDCGGTPPGELYALSVGDTIIATKGAMIGNGRFFGMFTSIIDGRFASESPGEQLLLHLVRQLCERGFKTFDLGTGEARYKDTFCNDAEPLFDSFIALTPPGRLLIGIARLRAAAKRVIKNNPTLWSMVTAARRLQRKLSAA